MTRENRLARKNLSNANLSGSAMPRRRNPADLTDAQWAPLEPLLPPVRPGRRARAQPLREIIDAWTHLAMSSLMLARLAK